MISGIILVIRMERSQELIDISVSQLLAKSPEYFIHTVFDYLILPHHQNILDHIRANQRSLDLAPRGAGKSRMLIGYAAWYAINNPDHRVLYLSDTDGHAMRFLSTIKNIIEASDALKSAYGELRNPKKWTEHEILFNTRSKVLTEANITAYGISSGGVTGGHYELIVMDDICSFSSSWTEGQRDKDKNWIKTTLLPTIMPGGEIHAVGTRYHYSDVWEEIIKLGFDTNIQQAIKSDGTSIWEDVLPLHDKMVNGVLVQGLDTIKGGSDGSGGLGRLIFNLQYMNDTSLLMDGNIFQDKYIQYYDGIIREDGKIFVQRDNFRTEIKTIHLGVDLAISQSDAAAYTVVLVVGMGEDHKLYVLEVIRKKLTFQQQKDAILQTVGKWSPNSTRIEAVAYQAAMVQELQSVGGLKIVPIYPTKDKVARAHQITGWFENFNIFFLKNMVDLIDELLLFPDGVYKDQVDALVFSISGFTTSTSEVVFISM